MDVTLATSVLARTIGMPSEPEQYASTACAISAA
jgi:hypothetical protein